MKKEFLTAKRLLGAQLFVKVFAQYIQLSFQSMSAMLRAIEALSLEDRTRFETKSMLARQIQTSAPTKNLDSTMP